MKYKVREKKSFEKDLKKLLKRGKNLSRIEKVVETLSTGEDLPKKYRSHKLSGDWANHWECHIEPDWLLIWHYSEDVIALVRTGSHSDLFK